MTEFTENKARSGSRQDRTSADQQAMINVKLPLWDPSHDNRCDGGEKSDDDCLALEEHIGSHYSGLD